MITAALAFAGLVLGVVALIQSRAQSVIAWAVVLVALALAWPVWG